MRERERERERERKKKKGGGGEFGFGLRGIYKNSINIFQICHLEQRKNCENIKELLYEFNFLKTIVKQPLTA